MSGRDRHPTLTDLTAGLLRDRAAAFEAAELPPKNGLGLNAYHQTMG